MARQSRTVARIVSVSAPTTYGYAWRWTSEDGAATSPAAFPLFYDCLSDARARGYDVELGRPPAVMFASFDANAGAR